MGQFALFVPTVVELASKLISPFFRGMVWRVNSRSAEIVEPRFVRIGCPNVTGPGDCLVGHIGCEVIALVRSFRLRHPSGVSVDRGVVLVRLALIEAVKIVETQTGGPTIEWPGGADVRFRCVMPFTEHAGGIAVVPQHLRDQCGALWNDASVARVTGAHLDDDTCADRMMIPPCE